MQMKESRTVTGDKSWVHHYQPESKRASMQWKHPSSPSKKNSKFKVTPSAEKVMLTVFCNSQGVLLSHFLKYCENLNCEVLLKLGDAIRRKRPCQLSRGYCFIKAMPDPIQPEQPRREFKNCSGNFLNISLTAQTWSLVTSICVAR
jgi:hypothetical protein